MGFLNVLKGIGSFIPGVGPAIGAVSSVLGSKQKGEADGRAAEAQIINSANRNAVDLYGTRQNAQNSAATLDLNRKKYTDDALGQNASRAVIAALLGGGQMGSKVSMPGIRMPTFSGGPMAALASNPEALKALASLGSQSSEKLTTPQSFTGGELLAAPTLQGLPQAPKSSGFLNTLSNIGNMIGAVSPYIPTPKKNNSTYTDELP